MHWVPEAVEKEIGRELKKMESLERESIEAGKAEALGQWAQLVVGNMYRLSEETRSAWVEDWETGESVELVFSKSPRIEAEEAFAKARRLRRGSQVVAKLLSKSKERLEKLQSVESEEDALRLGLVEPIVAEKAPPRPEVSSTKDKKKWTGRVFRAPQTGVPVLVGRNKRENDYLSCVVAKTPDVWLHARGAPGAHVLVQYSKAKGTKPHEDDLQFAANLAAFYSDFKVEKKVWVTCVDPKHLWKPPKAPPGAVAIKQELSPVLGFPDQAAVDASDEDDNET